MGKSRLMSIGVVALAMMWLIHFAANHFRQFGPLSGHTAPTSEGPSALVRSLRPNYPFSVIAGGAYSPGELKFADTKDPVVRAHYSDFDITHAKVVRLIDDNFQYVSYRIKDQVYWTKKKLRIPSGELLLTDGVQYARARCGNRLSDKPHAATSPHEPDTAVLSLPPASVEMLPRLALAEPPVLGVPAAAPADSRTLPVTPTVVTPWPVSDKPVIPLEPIWGGQPIIGPIGSIPPVSGTPPSTITPPTRTHPTPTGPVNTQPPPQNTSPVPEPSTVYLFLLTLAFGGWALLQRSSNDESDQAGKNK